MKTDWKRDEIEISYDKAVSSALAEVERLARRVLAAHPEFKEFIMAMGTWFFVDKERNVFGHGFLYPDRPADIEPLEEFIGKWDAELHLTGHPMRFTATGKITTNW